ncbi:spore coat protein GerQ [Paenibacillus hexagrammi]|uniref:Spore coat protein GerQ n=1 Tax=Paenibacillus hexagrammi TaxID=2908839 RepID=A0ABY3SFS3_9BACL|nr:spore coat protein GerQ [Paenibacillus sp. YPD9-1]UJF32310.1 spore coat protein GerQ [Paenibacillus sp. YPD9-1]
MMNNPYRSSMQVPYGYPTYPTYPGQTMVPATGGTKMPAVNPAMPMPATATPGASTYVGDGQLPLEQSFIENILRLNLGKVATIYMTYENNSEWNAKIFKGVLEAAGRDHIIISDPATGMRYLLLMVNLDYITFDEELNYAYPFAAQKPVGR